MGFKKDNVDFDVVDVTEHQQCIFIPEDTLRARLQPHLDSLNKPRDIVGAVALMVTLATSFFSIKGIDGSVTFFDGKISQETLAAVMLLLTVASIVYLIQTIHNRRKHSPTLDDIMDDIKRRQNNQNSDMGDSN